MLIFLVYQLNLDGHSTEHWILYIFNSRCMEVANVVLLLSFYHHAILLWQVRDMSRPGKKFLVQWDQYFDGHLPSNMEMSNDVHIVVTNRVNYLKFCVQYFTTRALEQGVSITYLLAKKKVACTICHFFIKCANVDGSPIMIIVPYLKILPTNLLIQHDFGLVYI